MNYRLKVVLVICAIWAVAAGAILFARSRKPTAESITTYVHAHDLNGLSTADRKRAIDHVADMLNHVTLEERQKLRGDGVTPGFFHGLTPDEQSAFLDETLPTGFKQMMESFNKMDPAKRKEFVNKALVEMRSHEGEHPPGETDEKNMQKMVDQGLRSFYSDADADVKLDMAPLVEQMQRNLQGGR